MLDILLMTDMVQAARLDRTVGKPVEEGEEDRDGQLDVYLPDR